MMGYPLLQAAAGVGKETQETAATRLARHGNARLKSLAAMTFR